MVSDNAKTGCAPRVFVSYSHDSDDHRGRVLEMVQQLRQRGLDVWVDHFETCPAEGWPLWMQRQVEEADFIVVACTENYRRRFEARGEQEPAGSGGRWEGFLALLLLYRQNALEAKVLPVIFSRRDQHNIPWILSAWTHYHWPDDQERLVRHLTGRAEAQPRPLGHTDGELSPFASEERAHDDVQALLDENIYPHPKHTNPASLLNTRYEVAPFLDDARRLELDILEKWCSSNAPLVSTRRFVGAGGSGKTRLFIEWIHRLRQRGWIAGFLRETPAEERDFERLVSAGAPTLIVIDYAEARLSSTTALLRRAVEQQDRRREVLRIVLLARNMFPPSHSTSRSTSSDMGSVDRKSYGLYMRERPNALIDRTVP